MEIKDLIALTLILMMTCAGIAVTCLSQRARDLAFFLLVAGAVLTHKLDVNFFSQYWYRGTTRGFEVSFLDILAVSLLVSSWLAPRYGRPRWYWPASFGVMILYFLYGCFSVAISEPKLFGLFELSKVLRGIIVFLATASFVRTERELALLVGAICCTVCFETMLGLKHRYLDGIYRVTGSLEHPNSLSMYICLVGPVLVAAANADFSKWLRALCFVAIASATIAIMLTISRAGIPIFALVMCGAAVWCASFRITFKKIAIMLVVFLGVVFLAYKSWDTLEARYGSASLEQEYFDDESEGRGVYLRWAGMIMDDHFFGVGLNNWSYWVSKIYGPRLGFPYEDYEDLQSSPDKMVLPWIHLAAPAHNLGALTVGELGVPGLLLFGLVWLRWFQMGASFLWRRFSDPMHRIGVGFFFGACGIFLQSVTEWTYRQTAILFTFHVMLGALASLYCFKRRRRRVPRREAATEDGELEEVPAVAAGRW